MVRARRVAHVDSAHYQYKCARHGAAWPRALARRWDGENPVSQTVNGDDGQNERFSSASFTTTVLRASRSKKQSKGATSASTTPHKQAGREGEKADEERDEVLPLRGRLTNNANMQVSSLTRASRAPHFPRPSTRCHAASSYSAHKKLCLHEPPVNANALRVW